MQKRKYSDARVFQEICILIFHCSVQENILYSQQSMSETRAIEEGQPGRTDRPASVRSVVDDGDAKCDKV